MLQASEGGSISVGNRKFKVEESATPPPVTPISLTPLEGTPVRIPGNVATDRIARVRSAKFSTLAAATDKIVVSRNVLIGLCMTTFALGIVTTLGVDRLRARASEAPAPREPEPVVLQTTPIEPDLEAPAVQAGRAPAVQAGRAPAAPAPIMQAAPAPPPAAAEAVVVQLPPASEAIPRRPSPPSRARAVRQVPAPPARSATTAHKRAGAVESDPTETAPDEGPLPAPIKKKWVDPFAE